MFWNHVDIQKMLFTEIPNEVVGCDSFVSELVRYFLKNVGDEPSTEIKDFARWQAFLTVKPSQDLFRRLIERAGMSVAEAKPQFMEWIDQMPSLETFSRTTRGKECDSGRAANVREIKSPSWYSEYLATRHFRDVKMAAVAHWTRIFRGHDIKCLLNCRHEFNEWHHSDYGRLGEDDEHTFMRPLCADCHELIRRHGPSLPANCPSAVLKWIGQSVANCK